jgi:hypothetical protein
MSKYCDVHPRRLATHDRANRFAPSDPDVRMNMCPECLKGDDYADYKDVQRLPGTMSLCITVSGFDGALVIHVPEGHVLARSIERLGLDRAVMVRLVVEEIQ